MARAKLVVLGPPGAILRRVVDSVRSLKDSEHLSADVLLDEEIARGTPPGVACRKAFDRGAPAPDEVVLALFRRWYFSRRTSRGFILAGFPASVGQAILFDEWLDARDETLTACVTIAPGEEDALADAGHCQVCPVDGSEYRAGLDAQVVPGLCNLCREPLVPAGPEAAERVRRWYRASAAGARRVAEYYAARGLHVAIDASPADPATVDAVLARLHALVADR